MTQYIEIASTDMRIVVEKLLELGKLGAYIDGRCPAIKIGPVYTTMVAISDDSGVQYSPNVLKGIKVQNPEPVVFTREQLEDMNLPELKKVTGIKTGNKSEIIDKFLGGSEE